jgi:hypothetical protein
MSLLRNRYFQLKVGTSLVRYLKISVLRGSRSHEASTVITTRAVWKVRGLTLLRVGTLWRCGNGLFFKVPPLASDVLLTTLLPLLENVLQTVDHLEIFCLGALFSWLEKPRNRMGRDLDCMEDVLMEFHRYTLSKPNTEFNSDLVPCDFLTFPTMKKELRGKKFRSDQQAAARFRKVGGAL